MMEISAVWLAAQEESIQRVVAALVLVRLLKRHPDRYAYQWFWQ